MIEQIDNTVEETLTQMKSGNQDGSIDISSGIGKRNYLYSVMKCKIIAYIT